jgi:HAD superfamily hydrolase (TIGR01509 family)
MHARRVYGKRNGYFSIGSTNSAGHTAVEGCSWATAHSFGDFRKESNGIGAICLTRAARQSDQKKLVILDIGSTIVEGSPGGPAARIGSQLGLSEQKTKELNRALMTKRLETVDDVVAFLGTEFQLHRTLAEPIVNQVWSAQEHEAHPAPGAVQTITALQQHGYQLALLSNIWWPYLKSVRRHFGTFFDEHIPTARQLFSFKEGTMKPDPGMFQKILTSAAIEATDAMMVGDSYASDLAPAIELGMKTVWVMQRPEREVTSIVAVMNGVVRSPTRAIQTIDSLSVGLVQTLFRGEAASRRRPRSIHPAG